MMLKNDFTKLFYEFVKTFIRLYLTFIVIFSLLALESTINPNRIIVILLICLTIIHFGMSMFTQFESFLKVKKKKEIIKYLLVIIRIPLVLVFLFQNHGNVTTEMLLWVIFILIASIITLLGLCYYTLRIVKDNNNFKQLEQERGTYFCYLFSFMVFLFLFSLKLYF